MLRVPFGKKFLDLIPDSSFLHKLGRAVYIQEKSVIKAFNCTRVPWPHHQLVLVNIDLFIRSKEFRDATNLAVMLSLQANLDYFLQKVKNILNVGFSPDFIGLVFEGEGTFVCNTNICLLSFECSFHWHYLINNLGWRKDEDMIASIDTKDAF